MDWVDLTRAIDGVRQEATALGDRLAGDLGVDVSAPPQAASNFMIKYAVISLELMDHYSRFWAARPPRDKEEEAERAERLMTVFRQMFVASMSALEFSAKLVLHGYPTSPVTTRIENLKDQRRNRRVYLNDHDPQSSSVQ